MTSVVFVASVAARELVDALGPEELAALAERLAPYLPAPASDGWLNSAQTAEYLAISRDALKRLTASRSIPFEQDHPGGRCYFLRSELDRWRQGT
jgi:excisionase family DNA binding protein